MAAECVVVAERLRRWTWNPLGYPRAGSNPADNDLGFSWWRRACWIGFARLLKEKSVTAVPYPCNCPVQWTRTPRSHPRESCSPVENDVQFSWQWWSMEKRNWMERWQSVLKHRLICPQLCFAIVSKYKPPLWTSESNFKCSNLTSLTLFHAAWLHLRWES